MNYTQKLRDLGACDEAVSYALTCESVGLDTLTALWPVRGASVVTRRGGAHDHE